MIRNNVFKTFGYVRIALATAVGIPFMVAANAYAQAEVERVVVTGSNIPTAEEVTAAPLDTLNTADIERAGTSDVLTVLTKRNPDFVGAGNIGSTNANISSGTSLGGALISIRGLPTLTLLNSRRVADSAAIAVGGAQFQDVNLFPTSLISRIEVFKDGASAIYGSEAVGGVVNIFLKQDFTGVEMGYRYGFALDFDVTERRGYLIAGVGNDTTHVTAGFQYYEIDPLFERQAGYSNPPLSRAAAVTTTYAGSARQRATSVVDPNGRLLLNDGINSPFDAGVIPGSIPASPNPPQFNAPGLMNTYHFATDTQVFAFDLSTLPTNTQSVENTNAYAAFTHQIFGKQLEAFGDFIYAHNDNESHLNAQPLSNGTGVLILGSVRVDPLTGALVPENRGPPAPFNPFQESFDSNTLAGPHRLTIGNRFQSIGSVSTPRIFQDDTNFYRLVGGLRSQITKDWFAEGAVQYSRYGIEYVNSNLVIADQLNKMIAGTAVDTNGNPIPPLDFFARQIVGTNPGQVSAAQAFTLLGSNLRKLDSYLRGFDIRVTGFPFELPGGPVGVSVGASLAVEGFKVVDSPEIFVGSVPIQNISTGRYIRSVDGELSIPIVGSQMNIPFIYSLEVNIAGRYDWYEGLSEDAKVPKYTLRYQPIKDLTLRGTYSNSFIAPTLYQLYGPVITGFSPTITFNGVVQDQAQAQTGSNPNLKPSTAEGYTAGAVYSPSFVPGLTITADYFHTLQQGIVGILGANTILQSVEAQGPASPYASLVGFNNFPGSAGSQPVTAAGQLNGNLAATFYIDSLLNLGAARVEGVDLTAHYNMDLRSFGQLELGVNAIVFTLNDLKTLPIGSPYYNISGLVGTEFFGSNPNYKVTFLAEHRWQGFTISLNANYIPGMLNAVGHDPETENQRKFEEVDDYISVDGRLSYEFKRQPHEAGQVESLSKDGKTVLGGKSVAGGESVPGAAVMSPFDRVLDGLRLTVGCNNILDEEPRFVRGGNSTTNLATYDPYQRFVYFEIVKKF